MNQQPTSKSSASGALHPPPPPNNKPSNSSYSNNKNLNFYMQNQTSLGHKPSFKKKFNNYGNNYSNGGFKNYGGSQGYAKNKNHYRYNNDNINYNHSRTTAVNAISTVDLKDLKNIDSAGNSFSNSNPVSPPTASSNSNSSNATESPPPKTGSLNNIDANIVEEETNNCDTSDNVVKQIEGTQVEEVDKTVQTVDIKEEVDLSLVDESVTSLADVIGNLQINQNANGNQTDKPQAQSNAIEKQTQPQTSNHHNHSQMNRIHPNAHLNHSSFKSNGQFGQFSATNVNKQVNKSHNPSNDNQNVPSKAYENKHYDKHQIIGNGNAYNQYNRYANNQQSSGKYFYNNGYHHSNNATGYQYQTTSHHNHNKSSYLRGSKKPTSYSNSNLIPNKSHVPAQNQSNVPNNNNQIKPHKSVNNVPVSAPQNHLLNQIPVSQSGHSVMPQMMPSNPIFYSIPPNQLPQHLNSSHSHTHPNIHPSNCLQCVNFLTAQQNGYFAGGNQQFAPANGFNTYPFVSVPYYNQQQQQPQQQQLNGNEDIQSQSTGYAREYRDSSTTPANVNQAVNLAGSHPLNNNVQQVQMRQFNNNNYQMNGRFNPQQPTPQYTADGLTYMPPQFNPIAYNPYVQFVPNYYQHYPGNSFIINNNESQMTANTYANSHLHHANVQQANVNTPYAISTQSGQTEQLYNSANLDTAVAAADSTTRSSSVHSISYENGNQNGGLISVVPQTQQPQFGDQMQQAPIKYYHHNYQQQQDFNNVIMWQNSNINNPVTNDELIHSSHGNANLMPPPPNVEYQTGSIQANDNQINSQAIDLEDKRS